MRCVLPRALLSLLSAHASTTICWMGRGRTPEHTLVCGSWELNPRKVAFKQLDHMLHSVLLDVHTPRLVCLRLGCELSSPKVAVT